MPPGRTNAQFKRDTAGGVKARKVGSLSTNGPASADAGWSSSSDSWKRRRAAQRLWLSSASEGDCSSVPLGSTARDGPLLTANVLSPVGGNIPGHRSTKDTTWVKASSEVETVQARLGRADLRPASYKSES